MAAASVVIGTSVGIWNSQHALDAAHNAADRTTNHGASDGADWPGCLLSYGRAVCATTHNSLSLGRNRHGKNRNNDNGRGELRLHEHPLYFCCFTHRGEDLAWALWRHHEAIVAIAHQNGGL
jgi:hypothetical protein